ncbi:MAG: shikimate dehydrogenase, partial [Thermodesulfovibrionales bacterium]
PDDDLPIPPDYLQSHHTVCDIIYKKTPLLMQAERLNLKTIDGSGMLLYQGVHAFKIWTGTTPPIEEMRRQLQV